jgi:DNA-binding HxlR family transcriptional regulator
MAERSYGQRCAVAHALDLVGERWALLIVRELLLGPKRFTDLRAGLPAASPNVLSQRLRELQDATVVRRHMLPPPAASWVYELTSWGRELEPVVTGLARWGASSPSLPPEGALSADSAVLGLRAFFDPGIDPGMRAVCGLRVGAERFTARVADGELHVEHGQPEHPDAIIEADPVTFAALLGSHRALTEAARNGTATVTGDAQTARRLVEAVSIPAPAAPQTRATMPASQPS